MGFWGKVGDVFHKIEYSTSNAPEIVGKRFEDHVENLFSKRYFRLLEKTHSFKTNSDRYVESSKNPDFIFVISDSGGQPFLRIRRKILVKNEIAERIKNRLVFVNLHSLNNMRMMADNHIGSGVN